MTRGQERCLTVWSAADFQRLTERLQFAPATKPEVRGYIRMLFAAASQEEPDKQGRITIPTVLREYASLGKDVMVIGAMNTVEIWDPGAWEHYTRTQEQEFSDLSDDLFPGVWPDPTN